MSEDLARRRSLLRAALAALQVRQAEPELAVLHRWLDSWSGIGHIVTGMERHGYDVSLTRYPEGWRSTFLRRDFSARPWVGQVLSFHPTPWEAVQQAAWSALAGERDAA